MWARCPENTTPKAIGSEDNGGETRHHHLALARPAAVSHPISADSLACCYRKSNSQAANDIALLEITGASRINEPTHGSPKITSLFQQHRPIAS